MIASISISSFLASSFCNGSNRKIKLKKKKKKKTQENKKKKIGAQVSVQRIPRTRVYELQLESKTS